MFAINLLGLGLGPTSVALITDYVFGEDNMLRYSMSIVGFSVCLVGLGLAIYALKHDEKSELLSAIEASTSA